MPAGGQEITGQQGSFGNTVTTNLRSNKAGAGASVSALSGQQINGQQGAFSLSRTRALTGSAITAATGSVSTGQQQPATSNSDWEFRTTGALFSTRLDSAAAVSLYNFYEGAQIEPSFDSTNAPDYQSRGSCKFTVSPYDGDTSGELLVPFGVSFSENSSFFISYSLYQDGGAYDQWNQRDGSYTGEKHVIISHTSSSHGAGPDHAVVIGNIENQGMLTGYHYGNVPGQGAILNPWNAGITACGTSTYVYAPAVDRGANPLTGLNPDTGAAWTSCEQDAARYGHLGVRAESNENRRGFGDWLTGAFRTGNGKWNAYLVHIQTGTWGLDNSRIRLYAAAPGENWFLVHDKQNIRIGNTGSGPFNAVWIGPYTTNRSERSGRQVSAFTSNIPGVTIIGCGPGTPRGAGELRYTASTQKLSWKSATSLHGTGKGFSYANRKTARVLYSSTDSQSLFTRLNGDCTFPSSTVNVISTSGFPSSGTILVGPHTVDYTGTTATSFTGCTMVGHKRPSGHLIRQSSFVPAGFTTLVGEHEFTPATDVINVASTASFPSTGELVYVPRLPGQFANYTGKTATSFTGLAGKLGVTVVNQTLVRLADYLVVDVHPPLLPTSGITNDTVTISEDRPQRAAHMADVIVSSSTIPAPWIPPYSIPGPGQVVAIGTNTAIDVTPSPAQGMNSTLAWQYSCFFSYSGGAVVEDYGRAGAWVVSGSGGHGAPDNVGALIFDLSTATWSRKDPTGFENFYKSPGSWLLAETSGFPNYEINGTNVPAGAHLVQNLVAVPRLWQTSANGAVMTLGRGAMNEGANNTVVIHKFDLASGLYNRPAANAFEIAGGGSGATYHVGMIDKPRRRWWRLRGDANVFNYLEYLDANDMTVKKSSSWPSAQTPGGWENGGAWLYQGMIFRRANPNTGGVGRISVWDPSSPTTAPNALTIDVPGNVDPQFLHPYVEYRGKFYSVPEVDISVDTSKKYTFLYRLTPPAGNIRTGTWKADTIAIPDIPSVNDTTLGNSNASGATHFYRLFKHPKADCLVWIPNGQRQVYLIRPE